MNTEGCATSPKDELLKSVEDCASIAELFRLVKTENIDIRMQTLCSASSIPPKSPAFDPTCEEDPLQRLKAAVKLTVENTR